MGEGHTTKTLAQQTTSKIMETATIHTKLKAYWKPFDCGFPGMRGWSSSNLKLMIFLPSIARMANLGSRLLPNCRGSIRYPADQAGYRYKSMCDFSMLTLTVQAQEF